VQDLVDVGVEELRELVGALGRFRGRQVDLVHGRDDREAGVARQVVVGERLRLEPLRGVDQQDRALAGRERPADLVGEVHVAGRVDQVELVPLVEQANGLRLDRDAAFALQVHPVEVLGAHRALVDGVRELEHPVGQRGLAVVDVRHDAEVADTGDVGRHV
jgi:hypothetical protein